MTAPCKYTPDDQVEFAYGEMKPEKAAAFRAHLESCQACQAAVCELEAAASLTKKVRSAPIPQAKWEKSFEIPASRPSALWRRPWFWAPVAAAAAALILFLFLRPAPQLPAPPVEPRPVAPPVVSPEPPPAFATVIETAGQVSVKAGDKLSAGGRVSAAARSSALLQLDDKSRILVGEKSTVTIEALGAGGDRLQLEQGHVACQVTPRPADRTFSVDTGLGRVKVTGTLFAILMASPDKLMVGVHQGSVDVDGVSVKAGGQLTLEKKRKRHAALGRKMRGLMRHFLPEEPKPVPVKEEQPPEEVKVEPEPEPEPEPKESAPDTLAALVDNMYRDTDWIFDDLRADIESGEWELVLHRLENYLSDPESPNRAEAVFLKAVCLEKLGRLKEARQTYRDYLIKWPAGSRAKKAKHGFMRTRAAP